MTKVFRLHEFNLSDLDFSEPFNNIVYISYNNEPILFETCELYCVDAIKQCNTKYSTHELLLSLSGKNDINTNICKTFFESLDNKIIETGKNNMDKWPFDRKNIAYKSLIRFIDDTNEYYKNGGIKLKFIKSKNFSTLVFDENKNIINPVDYENKLSGGVYVKIIIELVSIWIRDGVFGSYIKLHQLKISNNPKPPIYLFNSNSSENENENENESDNNITMYDTEINYNLDSIMLHNNDLEYILSD